MPSPSTKPDDTTPGSPAPEFQTLFQPPDTSYETRIEVIVRRFENGNLIAERKHQVKQMWLGGPEEDWVEQAMYLARKGAIEVVRIVTGNHRWIPNK